MSHHQGQNGRSLSDKVEDPASGIQIPPADKAIAEEEVPVIPKTPLEDEVTPLGENKTVAETSSEDHSTDTSTLDDESWRPETAIEVVYKVEEQLGRGSYGTVHRIYDDNLQMYLAVKTPLKSTWQDARQRERFRKEEAYRLLDIGLHPNIASCIYVRTLDENMPRLFIEYVGQKDLEDFLNQDQAISLEMALDIGIQICWGLGCVHKRGLVHQDIKPANILMTPHNNPKVADFGLVTQIGLESRSKGTEGYAAPEQKSGVIASPAADVYSLGVVLCDLFRQLQGWPSPYSPAKATVYSNQLKNQEGRLAETLRRCLAEKPEERFQDANELADRLVEIYPELIGHSYERQPPPEAELIADSLNNKAISLIDLKRPTNEVEDCFKEALRKKWNHPETLYNWCLYRWQSGEPGDELLQQLRQLEREHPGDWRYSYLVGMLWLEQGYQEAALEQFKTALAKSNENTQVKQALQQAESYLDNCPYILKGHTDVVTAVAVTDDGQRAVSASLDKTLRVWDLNSGACIKVLDGHIGAIHAIAIDDPWVVSGGTDGTIQVWNLTTLECVKTCKWAKRYSDTITSITFVPRLGNRPLLAASRNGRLGLYESTNFARNNYSKRSERVPIPDQILGIEQALQVKNPGTKQFWLYVLKRIARFGLSRLEDYVRRLNNYFIGDPAWAMFKGDYGSISALVPLHRTFEGLTDATKMVAISPDKSWMLSGGTDQTLRCWIIPQRRELEERITSTEMITGHTQSVTAVAISPDRRNFALSGSEDKTVRLWRDVKDRSGTCLKVLVGHTDKITAVTFLPDGQRGLSGSADHTLRLWELDIRCKSKRLAYLPVRPQDEKNTLKFEALFSKAEQFLSSGQLIEAGVWANQAIKIPGYESSQKVFHFRIRLVESWLRQAEQAWTYGRHKVAGAFVEEARSLLKYEDVRKRIDFPTRFARRGVRGSLHSSWLAYTLEGHTRAVHAIAITGDGRYALSGSNDQTLRWWDLQSRQCLNTLPGHSAFITCVALFPTGFKAVSGDESGQLYLWNLDQPRPLQILKGHASEVTSVAISPNGNLLLSGGGASKIKEGSDQFGELILRDFSTGNVKRLEGHTDRVTSVAISADGRWGLSGSCDKTIRLWDLNTGRCLRTFIGHAGWVEQVAFLPNNQHIISTNSGDPGGLDDEPALRLWEIQTGRCLRTYGRYFLPCMATSFDGKWVFARGGTDYLWLCNLDTGVNQSLETNGERIASIAVTPDCRYALCGGSVDGKLQIWEMDWLYEFPDPADWNESARPYLENFLTLEVGAEGIENIKIALASTPIPYLMDKDFEPEKRANNETEPTFEHKFKQFLIQLGYGGFGWLRPEGVWRELEKRVTDWQGPQPMPELPWATKFVVQLKQQVAQIKDWATKPRTPTLKGIFIAYLIGIIGVVMGLIIWSWLSRLVS